MKLLFAIIAVFWWVALWGLTDIYMQDMTQNEKIRAYIGMLVLIALIVFLKPDIVDRF
jgi:fucose 4-O-acetylase-like acetyltransferase